LIGSAVALEESIALNEGIIRLRNELADRLRVISGITVMGNAPANSSSHISIVIDDLSAEELLRSLLPKNISVDAGSACSPEDLTPSHVIASMGYSTPGHIRLTIHPGHQDGDIDQLIKILEDTFTELRD
jgi:cysteine desulfurase